MADFKKLGPDFKTITDFRKVIRAPIWDDKKGF